MSTERIKLHSLAFGMLLGILIMMSISAKSQDVGLESTTYIRNDIEMSGDVKMVIYNWEYWVISIGELQDTIFYTTIDKYKACKKERLQHVIVPEGSLIDSMSFGWESEGYIKYKNGDTYEFPILYKTRRRDL